MLSPLRLLSAPPLTLPLQDHYYHHHQYHHYHQWVEFIEYLPCDKDPSKLSTCTIRLILTTVHVARRMIRDSYNSYFPHSFLPSAPSTWSFLDTRALDCTLSQSTSSWPFLLLCLPKAWLTIWTVLSPKSLITLHPCHPTGAAQENSNHRSVLYSTSLLCNYTAEYLDCITQIRWLAP